MPQNFEDSMIFPLLVQAINGPYRLMQVRKSNGRNDVQHRKTCPVCGRMLVNLYRSGQDWKCRECLEKGDQDG